MKTKFAFSAFCMLVAMTMATGAFAQATFQVSAGSSQGRMNGHTEEAGGITLAVTSGSIGSGTDENGTVLIDFGVPVTNTLDTAEGNNIQVNICDEAGATANTEIEGNTITLTVVDNNGCGLNASINIEGVRLSLVGSGLDSIDASVTSTGDVRLLGGAVTVTVINSIVDELTDAGIDVAKKLTLVRHTGKLPDNDKDPKGYFKLVIMENTVRSFAEAQINLDFSGIPDDIEVTIDAWVGTVEALEDDDDTNDVMPTAPTTEIPMNAQLPINKARIIAARYNRRS